MSTISASTTTTTAYKVTADTTGTLVLQTGSTPTTAVTIDANQNMGLGVTPSAWSGSAANGVLQLKNGGVLFTNTLKDTYLGANYYFDGSVNKYIASGFASQFGVSASTGGFSWNAAASGSAGPSLSVAVNEKLLLREALIKARGNRTQAAALMGVSRRTLHRKLTQWPELDVTD